MAPEDQNACKNALNFVQYFILYGLVTLLSFFILFMFLVTFDRINFKLSLNVLVLLIWVGACCI